MEKIKAILRNKWFGFIFWSLLYILWFVVWTGNLWLLLGVVWGSLPVSRRAVDDLKYTRSTRMMLVACGVLLAAHTVLRIASLAAPASVPLGKASSGSFVVFSVLLLWYTVLMVKAYNVQRTKH